jgi:hypothetical protein
MRVAGLANVFAAGDVASSLVDGVHWKAHLPALSAAA